jgi:hypothetical protein
VLYTSGSLSIRDVLGGLRDESVGEEGEEGEEDEDGDEGDEDEEVEEVCLNFYL